MCGELEGQLKLQDMLRFAMDVQECRKLQFARYFSSSASMSMSAWSTAETDALAKCGHCDNCVRSPESIEKKDVTLATWQILQVLKHIENDGGRVTLGMLADLVRGAGGGSYGVNNGGKKKGKQSASKEKVGLDLEEVAGGKVALGKDETETLLVHLLLTEHLKETFHSTAYSINVYLSLGPNAIRVTRYSRDAIEAGNGPRIEVDFLKKDKGPSKRTKRSEVSVSEPSGGFFGASGSKRRKVEGSEDGGDSGDVIVNDDEFKMSLYLDSSEDDEAPLTMSRSKGHLKGKSSKVRPKKPVVMDSDDEQEDWSFRMTTHRPKEPGENNVLSSNKRGSKGKMSSSATLNGDMGDDVIEIPDSD